MSDGWDVYYATAGFGAGPKASEENAVAKKEFYIDIDCGKDKPYATKDDGLVALKTFITEIGLPKPTLVDSGGGIHAHWFLDKAVPIHEWKPVAEALKQRCQEKSFNVDNSCTADTVRVLRIPDTVNFKRNALVQLLTPIRYWAFDTIKSSVGSATASIFEKARELTKAAGGLSETAKLIASNRSSKFETIWVKSFEGSGCAQIKYAIENCIGLPEPLWRGVLSIANYCEDRDWAIHEVSKSHPQYDPGETENKAQKTKGPYTCETYQKLEQSELCKDCKHLGKISSPIQLGSEVKIATKEDNVVKVKTGSEETEYEIPPYPYPFFRGKNGGIYRYGAADPDTGEAAQELIFPHDVYAIKRMHDAEVGDVVVMRLHLPRDGVRTFMLRQSDVSSKDKLRDEVNKNGVTIYTTNQINAFQSFIISQVQELQFKEKAEIMTVKYGWTIDNTFIIGDREYTEKGVKYSPSAASLGNINRALQLKGDLETWKSIASFYEDEAFDMHALGVLAGFGSVLMHLSPENGGVLNYYSKASGTGKTTILKLANSIWGNPNGLMLNVSDTALSKVNRMGLLNGMVITIDEMTNASPEEISSLLYSSTQGRARNRMRAKENLERENNSSWKTISIWSSNSSLEDKLSLMKIDPQGEMARLIEVHLQTPVPSHVLGAQHLFTKLNDNYGLAGDLFMRYVIPNIEDVRKTWVQVRDKIYAMHSWTQTERYRLNLLICMVTGGLIARHLGLINYDIPRLTKKAAALIRQAAEHMRENAVKAVETIAMFVNANINNMLIIKSAAAVGTLSEVPIKVPNRGALTIRYEPDTKILFITQRDFNKWCANLQINSREMRSLFLSETGVELKQTKKRMGKGWDSDFGPVSVYEIHDAVNVLGLDESDLNEPATA